MFNIFKDTEKIESYMNWDEYYLSLAFVASIRSKDTRTKVGAAIVNGSKVVCGYNGFPKDIEDYKYRWCPPTKYNFVVHAEANTILQAGSDITEGGIIYLTHNPSCNNCAKLIIQSGIKKIVYGNGILSKDSDSQVIAALEMLKEAKIDIKYMNIEPIYEKIKTSIERARNREYEKNMQLKSGLI